MLKYGALVLPRYWESRRRWSKKPHFRHREASSEASDNMPSEILRSFSFSLGILPQYSAYLEVLALLLLPDVKTLSTVMYDSRCLDHSSLAFHVFRN